VIYCANHIVNAAQTNYNVIEKKLLVMVFAFEKFRPHLIGSHVIVFTNHTALMHLLSKRKATFGLVKWMLLI